MSYFIEFAKNHRDGFYEEFVIINKNNGSVLRGDGIDHRLIISREYFDYGSRNCYAQTIASNANGLITAPEPGVVAVAIPPRLLRGFCDPYVEAGFWGFGHHQHQQVLHFALLAVPADPDFTKVLATGTISFGGRLMPCPRIQLGAYPLYPNSATAVPTATAQVAQVKQQLVKMGSYDTVEAAMMGSLDPATISWNSGGPITLGGPLSNLIAETLGYDSITMGLFLTVAALNTL